MKIESLKYSAKSGDFAERVNIEFSYSDGKTHLDQQKKEGVWTVTTKTGNWMWHNVDKKFVLNTSD